ncbi:hypothetical protein [Rhodococcus sp. NPDC047139]|uniref:hypothetical protein n=1 Tax=Rhodococcus sp. NPDC047139 TaxID=3155141 RepID=UPI0033E89D92
MRVTDSLRILVYSDDATVRQQVRDALGTRLHPDLPPIEYLEVATGPVVVERLHSGGIDLAVLDGEAAPTGGMGLAKQLEDELDRCPPIVVLIARADDEWLARWSGAEVAMRHPVDPIRLGRQVLTLLTGRSRPA